MFQESEKECGIEGFTLNPSVLKIAIESYYQDIRRVKDYHLIVNKDKFKQAAYTIKWICKLRPFGFDRAVSEVKRHHLLVNEAMAWRAALVFLEIDPRDVDKDLFEHLLYSTYYRLVDEDSLLLICRLLNDVVAAKKRGAPVSLPDS